jgi:TolA-binding protein
MDMPEEPGRQAALHWRRMRFAIVLALLAISSTAFADPVPADGPPSEELANALRLYQQERYDAALALFERVRTGATNDAASNRQKAEFFLGKCLYHLGRFSESLTAFERVAARGGEHLYFYQTLLWLSELWEHLPQSGAIITAFGRYAEEDLELFNSPESQDTYARATFLMGRARYEQRRFPEAARLFERVPANAQDRAPAQEWLERARRAR